VAAPIGRLSGPELPGAIGIDPRIFRSPILRHRKVERTHKYFQSRLCCIIEAARKAARTWPSGGSEE